MLSEKERVAVADALWRAEEDRAPIDPLATTWPGIDVVDAYEIQLLNIRRRQSAGAVIRGHKVGLSARAMQQMLGVDEPDYGHLMDDMAVLDGSEADTGRYCAPRVEVEVGFVLGAGLSGPGCSVDDVLRATEQVVPCIEIIDSRIRDWKITLADTIADNASAAGFVVGHSGTKPEQVDLTSIGAVLRRGGEIVDTGTSGAVLGNPAEAVAWLANKVAAFGVSLEAGQLVLPGSCMRAYDVRPGDTVRAELDRLGHVQVAFV